MSLLRVKRIYEPPKKDDGFRVLVDRLWPRGLSKARARVDLWLRDIAPSNALRHWYGHDPAKWAEFQRRYRAELRGQKNLLAALRALQRRHRRVTLLFSSQETKLNNAVALAGFLRKR